MQSFIGLALVVPEILGGSLKTPWTFKKAGPNRGKLDLKYVILYPNIYHFNPPSTMMHVLK